MEKLIATSINRRRTLALLGGAAAAAVGRFETVNAGAASCVSLAGAQTEGPYWVEENLNRSDIRTDPSDGSVRPGLLLNLTINLVNEQGSTCTALGGARVDIWHCDAGGTYSDEAANNSTGKKFLRGYQITDDNGSVNFTTIYPGWYSGRTIHIHVRIRTYNGTTKIGEFVNQIFFDDSVSDAVMKQSPYSARTNNRDTRNANDMVVTGTNNGAVVYANLTQAALGYSAVATIGVNLQTAALAAPAVAAGGVVNAASFQGAIQPGSLVSIFGQNLAAASRAVTTADLVNGSLPQSLGGVSVTVNNKPAFLYYASPTQINAQSPDDSAAGSVTVRVTNSAGSSTQTATLQSVAPAFFTSSNYVAAVRNDGTVVDNKTITAKPGDFLELYGTGFGPTAPAVAAGAVAQTAAATSNPVTVTIGGVPAPVSFAGIVGAGLYQINVTVPSLSAGDQAVLAQVAGQLTPSGALLKIG